MSDKEDELFSRGASMPSIDDEVRSHFLRLLSSTPGWEPFLKRILDKALPSLGLDTTHITDSILELVHTLRLESDRGCALTAAAYIDGMLGELLRAFFVDDSKAADGMLEGTGGVASFSARIEMLYLLGLITPTLRHDLNLIRKIRNDFAHKSQRIRFSDQPIANRCAELQHDVFGQTLPARDKFQTVVMGVIGTIMATKMTVDRRRLKGHYRPPTEGPTLYNTVVDGLDKHIPQEIDAYLDELYLKHLNKMQDNKVANDQLPPFAQ